jgi:IPT/TIG domain
LTTKTPETKATEPKAAEPKPAATTTAQPLQSPHSINEPELPTPTEAPTLASLDPAEAVCGAPDDVDLHVHGTGFTAGSMIMFNGGEEPTTYVSETELTTIVRPSTASTPGSYPVLVRTGTHDSAPLSFTFTEASPMTRKRHTEHDDRHRR